MIHEVIESANALADLLEATAKRGLKRPRHQKTLKQVRAKLAKVFRSYFGRQREAFLREVKPKIHVVLMSHPPQLREAKSPGGRRFADALIPSSLSPLKFPMNGTEESEFNTAIGEAVAGAAATLAKELKSGETISDSVTTKWLRENSLTKLTGELSNTSTQRLRDAVADAWDAGGSFDQITKAITDTFEDFSTTRAELIAQTESADAYNEGRDAIARGAGLDEKAWETESGDPCPICIENEAAGWLDIDEDFPSGDDQPTAHPNCECVLNFRKSSEE